MSSDTTLREPHPADPSGDETAAIDGQATGDADTTGHSMLTLELARAIDADRVREAQQLGRDRVRVRDGSPGRVNGLLKRLRQR
jgi:hypothetical protein